MTALNLFQSNMNPYLVLARVCIASLKVLKTFFRENNGGKHGIIISLAVASFAKVFIFFIFLQLINLAVKL